MRDNTVHFTRHYQSRAVFKYEDPKPLVKTVYKSKKVTFGRPLRKPVEKVRQPTEKIRPVSPCRSYAQDRKERQLSPKRTLKKLNDQTVKAQREREHDKAVKCRPRVQRSSDKTLDNYDRPNRHKFVEQIYSTSVRAMREAWVHNQTKGQRQPLSEVYSPRSRIKIEPLIEPFVCPDWCADTEEWQKRQARNTRHFDTEFWLQPPTSPTPVHQVTLVSKSKKNKHQ